MDRPVIYTSEQGRSTDFLFGQRAAMIGLAKLSEAVFGTNTVVLGLAATPTSPAGMTVNVGPGQIYQLTSVDATAYGALAADTVDQIVKQGLVLTTTNLACPAPTTAGYSINYLIQATYQDQDQNNVVLPYYNSANPSQPLSGQNNSGAAQPTERHGVCVVTVKAGAAATTGTQTTPTPDSGNVGLWVVTVANGAASITSGNISAYNSSSYAGDPISSGRLLNTQVFTSTGTYTPTPGTKKVRVIGCGGGGAGGGTPANAAGFACAGSPGSGGSWFETWVSSNFFGVTVTVGAGGTGSSGAAGSSGGASSFGSVATAPGGVGGGAGTSSNSFPFATFGALSPAAATGGSIQNGTGEAGLGSSVHSSSNVSANKGGSSCFGPGPINQSQNTAGTVGVNPGTGGCGPLSTSGTAALAGGNGAAGRVLIYEYA